MRILPTTIPLKGTGSVKSLTKEAVRRDNNIKTAPQEQQGVNALVSREFLLGLAGDYKMGMIDAKEANNRFINTVVDNALDKRLGDKDKQELIKNIADFFAEDPDFSKNLIKNLNRLG